MRTFATNMPGLSGPADNAGLRAVGDRVIVFEADVDGDPAFDNVEVVEAKPAVYLLAQPYIDRSTVMAFLKAETDGGWDDRVGKIEYDDVRIPMIPGVSIKSVGRTAGPADSEFIPEFAGRVCYMSFDGKGRQSNKDYLDHIREVGHGSVLEHSNFTFIFTGVSRSFSHELVRHRSGFAYSQLSQRYVGAKYVRFVCPDDVATTPSLYAAWRQSCGVALWNYKVITDGLAEKYKDVEDRTTKRKMARQAARSVLPNSTETKIVVTANARAWRHFIEMRASPAAEVEIRRIAVAVQRTLFSVAPNLFGDYRALPAEGGDALETDTRKV